MKQLASKEEVQFYDIAVQDWPGEIEFYLGMVNEIKEKGGSLLELGCGTGRVALRLANVGVSVTGMDLSADMLAIGRQKSQTIPNIHWVEGDMKEFELNEHFNLILIPGHSFQFMLTPEDQIASLHCIHRHLADDGKLVIHLNHDDLSWLGDLTRGVGTDFQLVGQYQQGLFKDSIHKLNAWSYDPITQTASVVTAWETIGENGALIGRNETDRKHLHCFFRYEMQHLLARTGFQIHALYGDFYKQELSDACPDMIWVASKE